MQASTHAHKSTESITLEVLLSYHPPPKSMWIYNRQTYLRHVFKIVLTHKNGKYYKNDRGMHSATKLIYLHSVSDYFRVWSTRWLQVKKAYPHLTSRHASTNRQSRVISTEDWHARHWMTKFNRFLKSYFGPYLLSLNSLIINKNLCWYLEVAWTPWEVPGNGEIKVHIYSDCSNNIGWLNV